MPFAPAQDALRERASLPTGPMPTCTRCIEAPKGLHLGFCRGAEAPEVYGVSPKRRFLEACKLKLLLASRWRARSSGTRPQSIAHDYYEYYNLVNAAYC